MIHVPSIVYNIKDLFLVTIQVSKVWDNMVEVQLIKVWLKICKNIRTVNMYLPYVCCCWKLQCVLSWRSIQRSYILLLVSNHMKHWWPSGLKYYIQNQKISGSNHTRCSAGLWEATSLRGSRYPPGQNKKVWVLWRDCYV